MMIMTYRKSTATITLLAAAVDADGPAAANDDDDDDDDDKKTRKTKNPVNTSPAVYFLHSSLIISRDSSTLKCYETLTAGYFRIAQPIKQRDWRPS